MRIALVAIPLLLGAACTRTNASPTCGAASGESLAAADGIFRRDPSWLGGDGAYSVALGSGRVLWMFGDSFVAKSGSTSRRDAFFVRNTVAVQTGLDPTSAGLQFFWRGTPAAPSSFLPEVGPTWYWPMGGALVQGRLFLFYVAEKAASGGLGFLAVGNRVVSVDDTSTPPSTWTFAERTFPTPPSTPLTLLAPFVDGDVMYVYGIRDPGDHSVSVAKISVVDVMKGDFTKVTWWCGSGRGWLAASETGAGPETIFPSSDPTDNPSELSVSRRPDGSYVAIHSVGFGATKLALRTASAPEGPWSDACPFFTPPESNAANAFVYAGKAHVELDGPNLIATYVANSRDDQKLYDDTSLYFPRFVKTSLPAAKGIPVSDAGADR